MTWEKGERYEGEWHNEMKHGYGKYHDIDGSIHEG